jgi:hypothetical protein
MKVRKKKWYQVAFMPFKYLSYLLFGEWPKTETPVILFLVGVILSLFLYFNF